MSIRIALIGFGEIARNQHQPVLTADPAFELVALADPHLETDETACPACFPTLDALLASSVALDAVALCVPPRQRYALACQAIKAGLHVLLEKPPGATLSEVMDLRRRATTAHVTLHASWHSRHAPAVDTARQWLAKQHIQTVEINWLEDVDEFHPGQTWIWEPAGLGVFDPGINAFSIATHILPVPFKLDQARLGIPANSKTPIVAELSFNNNTGAFMTATLDWRHTGKPCWEIRIATVAGELILENGGERMRIDGTTCIDEPRNEYAGVYSRFSNLINHRESEVDLRPFMHVADAMMLGERYQTKALQGF